MTKKEAIQWLKAERIVRELFSESQITETIIEALNMAIEALEMQNNCIICPRCGREFSEYEGREQTNDK